MSESKPIREEHTLLRRIGKSIFPDPLIPRTESQRKRFLLRNLVLHFRPTTVEASTVRFSLSWGLGGMAVVLVLLQLASGVLLKFAYEPSPQTAYTSVQVLISDVPFGRLIRNLHHWCAHLLVLVAFLHLLRVFYTGAFHPPRQFNWIIGLVQMGLILAANFTGYLLPWDQLAYWAVTVSTSMLSYVPWFGEVLRQMLLVGPDMGTGTLRLFFALHTAIVPMVLIATMAFHFWRIRKAGGLVQLPRTNADNARRIPVQPDLLLRETVVALVLTAAVLYASILFDAPLGEPANPGLSPNPTRAPWYFAGFQELLLHLHPFFAVCAVPLVFGVAIMSIPYLKYERPSGGVWFMSPVGRKVVFIAVATALVMTPAAVLMNEGLLTVFKGMAGSGWIPFAAIIIVLAALYAAFRHIGQASTRIAVQGVFTFVMTVFVVLTMINLWFRGEGMALKLPW